MIVPPRVAPPIALLVALITVTLVFNVGIAEAPKDFFGARDGIVLLLPATGQVTSTGTVPEGLAHALRTRQDVSAASPEIMVMTTVEDRSVFSRGVDADAFLAIERARLVEGRIPAHLGEALAGKDLARALDVGLGSRLLVTGSLRAQAVMVEIVGIVDADGFPRDELLISLPVARGLADLPPNTVHLIRVSSTDPVEVTRLAAAVHPTFTYGDLRLSASDVLTGQSIILSGNVTNWGVVGGSKDAVVALDGVPVGRTLVYVPARSTVPFRVGLTLDGVGVRNLSINPTFEVVLRAPAAEFASLPDVLVEGLATNVTLVALDGRALAGVVIRLGDAVAKVGAGGVAQITPLTNGEMQLVAEDPDGVLAVKDVFVTSRQHSATAVPRVVEVDLWEGLVGTNSSIPVQVTLLNAGGQLADLRVNVTVDGIAKAGATVTLAPGHRTTTTLVLEPLPEGLHSIGVEGSQLSAHVEVYSGDPRVEAALRAVEAARADPTLAPRVGPDADVYVDRIVRNVALAATALTVAAAALAVLAVVAVWARHLSERASGIGILKSLGASREQVQNLVMRGTMVHGAIGVGAGIAGGVTIAVAIDATRLVRAFGHRIPPALEVSGILILALVALFVNVIIARTIAGRLYDTRAGELLNRRAGQDNQQAPELREFLEAPPR